MREKTLPLVVLVAAVAALVGSAAWAVGRNDDDGGGGMHPFGNGMMGYSSSGGGDPVSDLTEARRQAGRFADRLDLEVGEVMRFSTHYYAELEGNGRPATEVLVDPQTGSVYLEYGPAMMWNTRFGMMSGNRSSSSGMMGGAGMMNGAGMMDGAGMKDGAGMLDGFADPTWAPTGDGDVSAAEARAIARRWLAENGKGLQAGKPETFPGYYTLHLLRGGKVAGMMSVNAVTGAPWYHWWHGRFISMSE